MSRATPVIVAVSAALCLAAGAPALAEEKLSAEELAKLAQNPVANLISVPFQNNTNFNYGPRDGTQNVLNIQPVIPISLSHEWNLITRTILPVITQPAFTANESTTTGLGDHARAEPGARGGAPGAQERRGRARNRVAAADGPARGAARDHPRGGVDPRARGLPRAPAPVPDPRQAGGGAQLMRPRFAFACLVLLLAACGSPPKERYYTLAATASAPAPTAGASASSIAVGPVTLPEMIDQPQLVVQVAANQVTLYEFHRWASPLKSEVARVIAANLAQELGTTRVWSYAQTTLANPDYQVLIDVQRFDSTLGDAVTIDALWTVRRAAGGAPKSGRSLVREPAAGTGFDPLVAAHSRALARVSGDIASAIRTP